MPKSITRTRNRDSIFFAIVFSLSIEQIGLYVLKPRSKASLQKRPAECGFPLTLRENGKLYPRDRLSAKTRKKGSKNPPAA
jgi:hypothetical protein